MLVCRLSAHALLKLGEIVPAVFGALDFVACMYFILMYAMPSKGSVIRN